MEQCWQSCAQGRAGIRVCWHHDSYLNMSVRARQAGRVRLRVDNAACRAWRLAVMLALHLHENQKITDIPGRMRGN